MLVVKKTSEVYGFIRASPLVHTYGCVSILSLETGKFFVIVSFLLYIERTLSIISLAFFWLLLVVKVEAGVIHACGFPQYWAITYLCQLFEHHWSIGTKLASLIFSTKAELYHISPPGTIGSGRFARSLVGMEYGYQSMSLPGWFCTPISASTVSSKSFLTPRVFLPLLESMFPSHGLVHDKIHFLPDFFSLILNVAVLSSGERDPDHIISVRGGELKTSVSG